MFGIVRPNKGISGYARLDKLQFKTNQESVDKESVEEIVETQTLVDISHHTHYSYISYLQVRLYIQPI